MYSAIYCNVELDLSEVLSCLDYEKFSQIKLTKYYSYGVKLGQVEMSSGQVKFCTTGPV